MASRVIGFAAVSLGALARFALRRTRAGPTKLVILLSGKRKSGKDYLAEKLVKAIQELATDEQLCEIGRLSGPLKKAYAEVPSFETEVSEIS